VNLNQVTILTPKTVEAVEFYKTLGLRLIVDSLPRYARLECPDGGSTFSINTAEEDLPAPNTILYFECEELDKEVARLKSAGVEFISGPEDKEWLWRQAYLNDPAGNKICLFYAGENRKNPPWRVK
jgi:catechol 2,3-dioxygenase-like lactoylglutathione lyase family enzyme